MTVTIDPCKRHEAPMVVGLLAAAGLPVADVDDSVLAGFLVAHDEAGRVLGAVGLETRGPDGLLRSLVVDPAARGRRLGDDLVAAAEEQARRHGVRTLYLLTTTAADYFPRLGYAVGDRGAAPPAIAATGEFAALCPASAVMLVKALDGAG
jgi:amino-acid N-acetyltransferase